MSTLIASALVAGFFILSGAHAASAPDTPVSVLPAYTVTLTAYNAVASQTDGDPMMTASGLSSNPDVIAARSSDLAEELPYGTVIELDRATDDTNDCHFSKVSSLIGYRVIGDAMNSRFTNRVDVLLNQHDTVPLDGTAMNPARVLGVCGQVTVRVVGYMKLSEVPKTQAELAAMIGKASGTLVATTAK